MYHWLFFFLPTDAGGGVRFSLRGTTYQNNSLVTLEDIGKGDDALLCLTDQPACCRRPYTSGNITVKGNWFFPNGTRVPSISKNWNFHRTRGPSVVRMFRRKGGVDGLYRCDIPDAANVFQTIYIGVYNASSGEWYIRKCTLLFPVICICNRKKKIMYKLQPRIHYGICCTYLECPYSFLSGYYKSGLAIYIHRLR